MNYLRASAAGLVLAACVGLLGPERVRADLPATEASNAPAPAVEAAMPESPSSETPAPAGSEPSAPPTPQPYEGLRNPFWPVGFTPPRPQERATVSKPTERVERLPEPPKWDEATKRLGIKGIMAAGENKYMAVVNNQIVYEGDLVVVVHAGKRYRWKVHTISTSGVRFEPLDVEDVRAPAQ